MRGVKAKLDSDSAALAAEMLSATMEKRWRLPQWCKDRAVVNGVPLRKRGRPRKDSPPAHRNRDRFDCFGSTLPEGGLPGSIEYRAR